MIRVIQDTREKRPLLFPSTIMHHGKILEVEVVKQRLPEGDYCLEGQQDICLIERKASIREIHGNFLTGDSHRALKAYERLASSTLHPILLLESGVDDLLTETRDCPRPGPVLQHLIDLCTNLGIETLFVGRCLFPKRRRQVGELVLRFLVSYAEQHARPIDTEPPVRVECEG